MPDVIQLLSDHVANQIAAGEVILRPASAVKELLENSVDSGATAIRVIVRDAGKELVQVTDNGCGMSETDARLSFERHATSKIARIDDLFRIHTMGFRGEALASIAAVSQVTLKSRKADQELGTYLEIENSEVKKQEPCSCPPGTTIAMKNLFFSVPARRHFLKRNTTERRHIVDEFTHVALAFPSIAFTLEADGSEIFHLVPGTLKQRLLQLMGQQYKTRLVTVKEKTDYLDITGFVGKPETAKKTRGDQYFFVNNRYIRSGYLNHAVMGAFADLIPKESYPMYVLFIDLDATRIDINVHPTKQEIKFEDEKLIYAFVQSAIKHALARFSIMPTLDFELDSSIQDLTSVSQPFTEQQKQQATQTGIYQSFIQKNQAHAIGNRDNPGNWKDFYPTNRPLANSSFPSVPTKEETGETPGTEESSLSRFNEEQNLKVPLQIHNRYILQQIKSGFILIDQQTAHERILYDRYQQAFLQQPLSSQQSLFPQTLELSPADTALLTEMLPELKVLGYDVQPFGKQAFAIHGIPSDLESGNEKQSIEGLLEQFKHFSSELKTDKREKMIRSLARQHAVKPGRSLSGSEMQNLIDQLFACKQFQTTPGGKYTFIPFRIDELEKLFGH